MREKKKVKGLSISISELIARQEEKELEEMLAKRRELTHMSDSQLKDYIYAQLSDWPVPIDGDERKMLYAVMRSSVDKMKVMSVDYNTRKEQLIRRKENRERQARIEQELKRPKLWEMQVDV